MLLPAKAEVARHLRRHRVWERAMLASPDDRRVRATFEDSGYTLCVLMGKRCAREAADAAERYLRTNLGTYLREQGAVRPHVGALARRGRGAAPDRGPAEERWSAAERRAPQEPRPAADRRSRAGA
ncbi:DUF5133 domain-containing protein [Streptomyces sp. PsTaAH-124]|uniref:DUF5133 domain-containing protein n=1 Tax=Streptomyces sp. PsTaAH-124 TaxID=1157638 RepID=UPI000379DC51|nr:DUF5133 domain-containing protein [Streptomyces sp. PsTaAH-124]